MPQGHKAAWPDQHQNIDGPESTTSRILHCVLPSFGTTSTLSKQRVKQHNQSHQPYHTTNLPLHPPSTTLVMRNPTHASPAVMPTYTTTPNVCRGLIVHMTPSRISRSLVMSTRKARVVIVGYHISAIAAHVHDGRVVAAGPQGAEMSVGRVGWTLQEVWAF